MTDLGEKIPDQTGSGPTVNRTMLDHIILRHSPNVQSANVEDESVLLDLSTGRYYTLNRLGRSVWEHCAGHNTVRDIHALLCDRFEVVSQQAENDLVAFINHMVQEGLLLQSRRGEESEVTR